MSSSKFCQSHHTTNCYNSSFFYNLSSSLADCQHLLYQGVPYPNFVSGSSLGFQVSGRSSYLNWTVRPEMQNIEICKTSHTAMIQTPNQGILAPEGLHLFLTVYIFHCLGSGTRPCTWVLASISWDTRPSCWHCHEQDKCSSISDQGSHHTCALCYHHMTN